MARRKPSPDAATVTTGALPENLMPGPCIEDWAETGPAPSWARSNVPLWRAVTAYRRWSAEVRHWVADTGWSPDRPGQTAASLARSRHPWSREFLTDRGETDLVDYYEGRSGLDPQPPNLSHSARNPPPSPAVT